MTPQAAAVGVAGGLLSRHGRPYARRFVEVDGGPIAYVELGGGERVVVLVHGVLTAADDMLLALAHALVDCRIIAFDRPGFGQSPRRTAADSGVLRQARRLTQALDRLDVASAVLVGHSFGGPVALAMAMAAPDRVAGLVLLAPLVMPEPRLEQLVFGPRGLPVLGGWISGWSHQAVDKALLPLLWRAMFLPQSMPARVEDAFPFSWAGDPGATRRVGEDSLSVGPDLLALLARAPMLQTRLHVLGGSADLVVNNLLHGQMLAALAPNGQFSLVTGVGHMIHHARPGAVAAAIEAYTAP
ncbi:alpha/beta fold hydrolase [Caulobacter hibisci]|uniref:Alpha/beta hydrolase n=1 Tax=Caulobacter hibisci TaxID=2035993 RepID=A0ABS0SWR7_9CAUL|nr:alpha/beta hydrolase [Caulobacter hibisci]MBI1684077.1 alpha/beta hydrolase [Caulobacter hibisci]